MERSPAGTGLIRATLRSRERLGLNKAFRAIRRQGSWAHGSLLSIGTLPNHLPFNRLGLRVQRRMKGAVLRNRTKRLLRNAYQRHKDELASGHDLFVVLHLTEPVSWKQLEGDFLSLCRRLGLLG